MKNFDLGKFLQANGHYVLLFIAGVFVWKKFFSDKSTENEKSLPSDAKKELEKSKVIYPLTFPLSQYSQFADKIEQACIDVGTDEEAIFSVFNQMKNLSDVYQLIDSFGTRTKYFFGISQGQKNLAGFLTDELSSSELGKINTTLKFKGINFSF